MFSPDDYDEFDSLPRIKNMPEQKNRQKIKTIPNHKPKRSAGEIVASLADPTQDEAGFTFTYAASRHEREWITNSLGTLYQLRWFSDVLRLVKGGKEASVYQCACHPASNVREAFLAAKIYRPRKFRQLKNDHLYREGRDDLDINGNVVINSGMLHAMRKRTEYGRELLHTSWIGHEFKTMQILHAAGADIPVPYVSSDNAILMQYVGGEGAAASTLNTLDLAPEEARPLFERVLHNIELMLAHGRVHGDLSAYNILYWEGEITLIDFPQAIAPLANRNSYQIFERDVTRVCDYFGRQGIRADARRIASKMWTAHRFRLAPEVHPRLLDAEDEKDRVYWEKMKNEQRE
jgi:RIO kinase 1